MADRLNELHRRRADLKLQGRLREMIPTQLEIIALTEPLARVHPLANAWNYLSHLYHQTREYEQAEHAGRRAIDVYAAEPAPSAEVLGTYQFKLATILAAQRRFSEAVAMAETAIASYRVFHDPPDDFLTAREDDLRMMRELRDGLVK